VYSKYYSWVYILENADTPGGISASIVWGENKKGKRKGENGNKIEYIRKTAVKGQNVFNR
jgi:hypothetical protein